jgi:phosphate-selective porin OprO/OprP
MGMSRKQALVFCCASLGWLAVPSAVIAQISPPAASSSNTPSADATPFVVDPAKPPAILPGCAPSEPVGSVKAGPVANDAQLEAKYTTEAVGAKDHDEPTCSTTDTGIHLSLTWTDGLIAESADKDFKIHIGGRFDWDSGWYSVPANIQENLNTPLLDGTDLRRFRFVMNGTAWEQMDFALEADFSRAADFKDFQSTPQTNIFLTNAWVGLHDLPWVDTVKLGHQKEYMTFANATSANFIPFMERPYIFDAYEDNFSWDNGISTSRTYFDEHATSWFGVFWNGTRSQAFNVGGRYAASGRLTWLPIYDEAEQAWLNLGVSGSWRSASQSSDPTTVSVRPLVRTGQSFQVPNLINTGQLPSRDGLQILGTGVHAAWGRFTFGSEFLCWFIDNAFTGGLPNPDGTLPPGVQPVGNLFFSGFYVEALYFLTPDHQPINRVTPGYARVHPVRNFLCKGDGEHAPHGLGAWEVGIRYDHVDVNSGLVEGGRLDSITLGLNWYLNPNARIMLNYVWTEQNVANPAADGSFSAFGVRVHYDF